MDSNKVRHSDYGRYRRIEVITGERRRRQWTASEKAQIVAESFFPGANISDVARRYGMNAGVLFRWRREALAASPPPPTFVPVTLAASSVTSRELALPPCKADGTETLGLIEIELAGAFIRLRGPVNEAALSAVLAAVRETA
jgi:transposase